MSRGVLPEPRNAQPYLRCFALALIGWAALPQFRLAAREVEITILHTANVRGHVLSMRYRERAAYSGGLLRCMTMVRAIREEQKHVFLIDCGGLLYGSPESALTGGSLPLEAAGRMGVDARVAAASDLSRGAAHAARLEARSRIPVLAANCAPRTPGYSLFLNCRPYTLWDCDGVRVAMVGLGSWAQDEDALFQVTPPEEALREVLHTIRSCRAQVTVLALHVRDTPANGRPNPLLDLARKFPDFDVILGGAGATPLRGAAVGTVLVARAAPGARSLGRVNLVYDTEQDALVRTSADMIEIGPEVPEDAELTSELGAALGRARHQLEQVVGYTDRDIGGTSRWPGQSGIQALVCQSVQERMSVEIVLWGAAGQGSLARGPILYRDICRAVPEDYRLAVVHLTAAQLREVLEANAVRFGEAGFLGIHGAHYRFDRGGEGGEQITELRLADGEKPHGRRRLVVACSAGMLQPGEGNPAMIRLAAHPEARLTVHEIDTREYVIDYIRRHSPLDVKAVRGGVLNPTL